MLPKLLKYNDLHSTNKEAARLIKNGDLKTESIIITDYQKNGRGQRENIWVTDAGKNLLLSWIVFPEFLSANQQFLLSKSVCLGISGVLDKYSEGNYIKWPNDIVIDNCKIGGVLIENSLIADRLLHSIIGIGLNVNQHRFPNFDFPATSLKKILSHEVDKSIIFKELMGKLEKYYQLLIDRKYDVIDQLYLKKLYRKDIESEFYLKNTQVSGIIRGVNELGHLFVEIDGQVSDYGFHEIRMKPPR